MPTAWLAGCASGLGDVGMVVSAMAGSAQKPLPTFGNGLNPAYRYLYVRQIGANQGAVFVMGVEQNRSGNFLQGWYSSDGAYIETFAGRLSAARGFSVGWAQSSWQLQQPQQGGWLRTRDVLPSHTFGVQDFLTAQSAPASSAPADVAAAAAQLLAMQPQQITWVQESIQTSPPSMALPSTWAVPGTHRGQVGWVYSRQCLATTLCFDLAAWPPEAVTPSHP